jgi:hypothetical protein
MIKDLNRAFTLGVAFVAVALLSASCGCEVKEQAPAKAPEWTDEIYPTYIRRLTHFGERADWSHDGKRILFLSKTYGDAFEVEVETGKLRPLTHHYFHNGYTRALYLSNGDILLSGSKTFDPEKFRDARFSTAELWVLRKDSKEPAMPVGEFCSEGPAVSRRHLKIAWAVTHRNYPDRLPEGASQMWMAEIIYASGKPALRNKALIADSRKLPFNLTFETQNFVPPDEKELTLSAYGYQGTEVMMLNLESGEIRNMSNAPNQYDEPEGIFPDGKYTLVECDKHSGKGSQVIDLYRLKLDGSGELERITHFSEKGLFKASNPVVSDDGRFIAFQVPRVGDVAGVGWGIYLLDLQEARLKR